MPTLFLWIWKKSAEAPLKEQDHPVQDSVNVTINLNPAQD